MATWEQFQRLIKTNYQIHDEVGDVLSLVIEVSEDRSQLIVLERQSFRASKDDWVMISSPVGKASAINLTLALMKANDYVVGGLTIDDDILIARHAEPLANLDAGEIDESMRVLAMMADQLEASLVGGDDF